MPACFGNFDFRDNTCDVCQFAVECDLTQFGKIPECFGSFNNGDLCDSCPIRVICIDKNSGWSLSGVIGAIEAMNGIESSMKIVNDPLKS